MIQKQIRTKVERLLDALSSGVYEREEVLGLSLLSAAAGESIFLLGLPGVAKSLIARRLGLAFKDARRFEYLMSRFSTPDEIFGPVSISKLKDEDTYERVVDGYLPTADVVFLDEIWKAGPAIQNSLLTALNEKLFRNGRHDMTLPLKCIIAASNELPAEGEGLEALWDRFLFRYIVNPLSGKENFFALLDGAATPKVEVSDKLQFSSSDMLSFLDGRNEVTLPPTVMELIYAMRKRYAKKAIEQLKERAAAGPVASNADDEDVEPSYPYVSDRRWKKIAGILRTSALLNGRDTVDWSDCLLLEHLIWDKDTQLPMVRQDLATEIISCAMKPVVNATSTGIWKTPSNNAENSYWSPDGGMHYGFEAGGDLILILASDYEGLGIDRRYGRFTNGNVISVLEQRNTGSSPSGAEFTVRKPSLGMITINDFSYPLKQEAYSAKVGSLIDGLVKSSATVIAELVVQIDDNLFTRKLKEYPELEREIRRYQGNFGKSGK